QTGRPAATRATRAGTTWTRVGRGAQPRPAIFFQRPAKGNHPVSPRKVRVARLRAMSTVGWRAAPFLLGAAVYVVTAGALLRAGCNGIGHADGTGEALLASA